MTEFINCCVFVQMSGNITAEESEKQESTEVTPEAAETPQDSEV